MTTTTIRYNPKRPMRNGYAAARYVLNAQGHRMPTEEVQQQVQKNWNFLVTKEQVEEIRARNWRRHSKASAKAARTRKRQLKAPAKTARKIYTIGTCPTSAGLQSVLGKATEALAAGLQLQALYVARNELDRQIRQLHGR